MQKNLKSKL